MNDDIQVAYCLTQSCPVNKIEYKLVYSIFGILWQVKVDSDWVNWNVAAETPICPYCGQYPLTKANIEDGVEGITEGL